MDDTFTFVAPVMPRRQIDPFAWRLAVTAVVTVVTIGAFANFVIRHEHAADVQRTLLQQQVERADAARAAHVTAQADTAAITLDQQARDSADHAVTLARGVIEKTSVPSDAGPFQLSGIQPSLLFVDGPSTSPGVVSIATTDAAWAAAVRGPSGACYWVRLSSGGETTYGTGRLCTGAAAMSATGAVW